MTIRARLSSFRGARKREPGIHFSAEFVAQWIPGLRLSAHPGTTPGWMPGQTAGIIPAVRPIV